jgi:hypothetical protein
LGWGSEMGEGGTGVLGLGSGRCGGGGTKVVSLGRNTDKH